jgi:hypothetical protein
MLKNKNKNHAKNQWKKSGIVTPLTTTTRNNPRIRGKIALQV